MAMTSVLEPHITRIPISSLDEILDQRKRGFASTKWLFRGQLTNNWGLQTTLERTVLRFGHLLTRAPIIEKGLIRRFIRQSYHYSLNLPNLDNVLEWLALMRHYGAPTRLQDWTESFYVALYFAIENADGAAAIWALDRTAVDAAVLRLLPSGTCKDCIDENGYIDSRQCFSEVFDRSPPTALVLPVDPFRLNERLVIQQGVFLCPGDVSRSFEENLAAALPSPPHNALLQFIIGDSVDLRKKLLWQLQHMNMNSATLFPGLDGFARSLATLVAFPETIPPGKEIP
ncbi:MAG: FRG domain-containing protein [Chloroflexota bacterium]